MSELETAGPRSAPSGFEELARTTLLEGTDARSVGPLVSQTDEGDGVVSLRFESNVPGYLGWKWTVSVAKIGGAEPTVLESGLMPGDGALLAPEWVPWSDRLDEYNAGRAAAEADLEDDDALDDEDLLDDDDLVDDDLGDDEYDGVDVDAVLDEVEEDEDLFDADDGDDDAFDDILLGAEPSPGSGAVAEGVEQPEQAEGDAGDAGPDDGGGVGPHDAGQQADERD